MISRTTERFRKALGKLPSQIRQQARQAYELFERDPGHPSLRFKKIHPTEPIYSVRISTHYRAAGVMSDDTIVWFWIGSHADHDRLISRF